MKTGLVKYMGQRDTLTGKGHQTGDHKDLEHFKVYRLKNYEYHSCCFSHTIRLEGIEGAFCESLFIYVLACEDCKSYDGTMCAKHHQIVKPTFGCNYYEI